MKVLRDGWNTVIAGLLMFLVTDCQSEENELIPSTPYYPLAVISPWGSPWLKLLSPRNVYNRHKVRPAPQRIVQVHSTVAQIVTNTPTVTTTRSNSNSEHFSRPTTSSAANEAIQVTNGETSKTHPSQDISMTPASEGFPGKNWHNHTSTTAQTSAPQKRKFQSTDCRQFRDKELYGMLERVGAYNQRFMAHTPKEAGQRFPHLLQAPPITIDDATIASSTDADHAHVFVGAGPIQSPFLGPPPHHTISGTPNSESCGPECQRIEQKLTEALRERDENTVQTSFSTDDVVSASAVNQPTVQEGEEPAIFTLADEAQQPGTAEAGEENIINFDRGCSLDKFIPIGNCTKRGEEELWGFEKLCSSCHGIFMLSSRCFPQFFNSLTCDKSDNRCIFDWWTKEAHGKCHERTLTFTVMRNLGNEECQKWHFETLNVPTSCECYLSKTSWLRS